MIDPENPCGYSGNWCESKDPSGGTPGYINSVHAENPDIGKTGIVAGFPESRQLGYALFQ